MAFAFPIDSVKAVVAFNRSEQVYCSLPSVSEDATMTNGGSPKGQQAKPAPPKSEAQAKEPKTAEKPVKASG